MRFNHMELTFPRGTLTPEFRADIDAFWSGIFGWEARDVEIVNQNCHMLRPDDGQFILLAESDKPLESPGYDHLVLLCDTREDVDHLLEQCQRFQEKDDRVRIKNYDDLNTGNVTVRAFYVKYLLPIWFDVQSMEWKEGAAPQTKWQYA